MKGQSFIAQIFLWKRFSSFTYLNITQFLVTLNDAIFRFLVAFSLISILGTDKSGNIMFLSGLLFVAPFLVFSMPAGELADKCSKKKVIVYSLALEVLGMIYGIYAMFKCSEFNAYASLFFIAVQASIFVPSKYAILPEIVKKDELSKANGYMTLATYVAIILGTFLASFFTQITGENYTAVAAFCFILSALGFFTSLQIETTPAQNPDKKIKVMFLVEVYKSLKLAKKYPHLLLILLIGGYFVFTAAFTQLNIIPFGIQSLKITDVQSGYILLAAALGVGLGSLTVAIISGKNVELGIAIWGGVITSFSYILLGTFSNSLIFSVLMVLSLGFHGGLFIVPVDAYIQIASPEKDRGQIVAAGSFLGFLGVLIAALCLGFFTNVLKISAATGYLIVGLLTLVISIITIFCMPEYFSRILAVTFFKSFFHIDLHNQPHTDFYESVTILCRKYSILHILCMIYLYPRMGFVRFVKKRPSFFLKPINLLLHIIPIPIENEEEFKQEVQKAVDKKMPLCIFLEGRKQLQEGDQYKKALENFFIQAKIPSIFLHIHKKAPQSGHKSVFNIFKAISRQVEANFSEKKNENLNFSKAQEALGQIETPFHT